jgi:FtsZ-interacting cell division protein ZipA
MSTAEVIILIVAIAVVLFIAAYVISRATAKRSIERNRARAAELRSEEQEHREAAHQDEAAADRNVAAAHEARAIAEDQAAVARERELEAQRKAASADQRHSLAQDRAEAADEVDPDYAIDESGENGDAAARMRRPANIDRDGADAQRADIGDRERTPNR